MHNVLEFLHGKKATIISIAALVIAYLLGEEIIGDNLAFLLNGILVILGGGADIATKIKLGTTRK